ncbi:hypothetical protein C8J56DRAFT_1049017 [Mycena floridula]|nr:hypothetical protein C8J56DRAFT_1049017 [Mycena floridula]
MRDKLYVGEVFTGSDWEIDSGLCRAGTLSLSECYVFLVVRLQFRTTPIDFLSQRKNPFHSGSHSRSRSRSRSTLRKPLPHGAASISESDYFQKSDEFRLWLKDEKGKYLDKLSGEKARSYFRKFVKAWNCGSLSTGDIEPLGTTGYKWSFTKCKGREDDKTASRNQDIHKSKSSSSAGPSRVFGPTLPSTADLVLAREREEEDRKAERSYKQKRDKAEDNERIGEMVGPAFPAKGNEGLEVDESRLLGGGDSFKDYIRKRDEGSRCLES